MTSELFEPFVSSERDGMGRGLLICRSIVEAHGGRRWIEPNRGGGTIFIFPLGSGLNGGNNAAERTVHIVDDDPPSAVARTAVDTADSASSDAETS